MVVEDGSATFTKRMKTVIKNAKEARIFLLPPLIFGSQTQIDAADFVALAERVIGLLGASAPEDCDECDGEGEVDCECDCGDVHNKKCQDCDGEGRIIFNRPQIEAMGEEQLLKLIEKLRAS